jgi:hypothetical protein
VIVNFKYVLVLIYVFLVENISHVFKASSVNALNSEEVCIFAIRFVKNE